MCGICLIACSNEESAQVFQSRLQPCVYRRGPDCIDAINVSTNEQHTPWFGVFIGTVLSLRGSSVVSQPLQDSDGNVFSWNGEVFGGGIKVGLNDNDATKVFQALQQASDKDKGLAHDAVLSVINTIKGPWAFCYYERNRGRLWFCRDFLGRRSLVWNHQKTKDTTSFVVSSVAQRPMAGDEEWQEVPVKVLHCIELSDYFNTEKTFQECHTTSLLSPCIVEPPAGTSNMVDDYTTSDVTSDAYVIRFLDVLQTAVNERCFSIRSRPQSSDADVVSYVGVLFSGGIDSMVLAALADRVIPEGESIDLINVAFQKHQSKPSRQSSSSLDGATLPLNYDVPDRLTGRQGVLDLRRARRWNFIEVDVDINELQRMREERIADLVYPSCTVLDDSIGCALWFAARGVGRLSRVGDNGELTTVDANFTSTVKVLLAGMGADEQLGGYSRHRGKFQEHGWLGLKEEMEMELNRIATRNLGRDDRCISDLGREARFPFLDEDVVSFLNSVPVHYKCDPRLPRGEGEKIILRKLARKMNLDSCSVLPKRAIQFGSRIAKLERTKEKGNEACQRLRKNIIAPEAGT